MKKKLLKSLAVVAVIALLLGGGLAVANQGNKYQNKKAQERQAQVEKEAAQAKEIEELKAFNARVVDQYTQTRLECEKGLGLSAKLTTFQRQTVQAPTNCGPAVLQ